MKMNDLFVLERNCLSKSQSQQLETRDFENSLQSNYQSHRITLKRRLIEHSKRYRMIYNKIQFE